MSESELERAQELTEEQIAEYHGVCEKLKLMEELKSGLRDAILQAMGRADSLVKGSWAVFVKEARGRTSIDFKAYIKDTIGDEPIPDKYIRESDPVKRLEVRKIG